MYYTTRRFWECYNALPESVQRIADQCYEASLSPYLPISLIPSAIPVNPPLY